MEIGYMKKYSHNLNRDMEYKTYGTSGHPVLVFPSQDGRFYDYQDFDMVGVLSRFIDSGQIRLICADSIDKETWSATGGDYRWRIELHERWFRYITDELIPDVRHYDSETFIVTGCSMGGFHAGNFFFRRPDIFDTLVALSGLYYAGYFFPNYNDGLIYENSPYDFLRNMPDDHYYWNEYRKRRIIMCVGQGAWEDELLESTRQMDALLKSKNVPAWIDYWGYDSAHDWAWWRKQIVYFMGEIVGGFQAEYVI
ncbi:MAG: esterase family protein [Bacteroidales bacterium]|nr:esterase family protein [Bacteroidales bacterium]MBQ5538873.1 esterase family protein [Bacteroidales bacterium]